LVYDPIKTTFLATAPSSTLEPSLYVNCISTSLKLALAAPEIKPYNKRQILLVVACLKAEYQYSQDKNASPAAYLSLSTADEVDRIGLRLESRRSIISISHPFRIVQADNCCLHQREEQELK
jgi:hypothetical protein